MEPIRQNDYYGIFQTGLLIALEELGVKQGHLADVCEISEGYLSKLKGWNLDQESGMALARPHRTNTNFKRYAVPLMQFLEQEYQIIFNGGYFIAAPENAGARQWGDLKTQELPNRIRQSSPDEKLSGFLDGFEVPEAGELAIEWNLDISNPRNLYDMVEKISRLAEKANAQMSVVIKLRKKQKLTEYRRSAPAKIQPGPEYKGIDLYGVRNEDLIRIQPEPEQDYEVEVRQLARQFRDNPYVNLSIEPGQTGAFEHISGKDALSGLQQEQFCDYSDWEALHREGDWDFMPQSRIIRGRGMHQYLLSRYCYGTHPYCLHAVLRFDGYAEHTGPSMETANAGIILGWQNIDGRDEYYHLLLDGQTMRLEQIGAVTGNHFSDFQHLDDGVPFSIEDGSEYNFLLRVTPETITVLVDNQLRYQITIPPGMKGRVGIRPWRARVYCQYFEVKEEPELLSTTESLLESG